MTSLKARLTQLERESQLSQDDFSAALNHCIAKQCHQKLGDFLGGIETYQKAAKQLEPPEKMPWLWQRGAARLVDYRRAAHSPSSSAGSSAGGNGSEQKPTPQKPQPSSVVLVVPSLINRATILDLDRDQSFMRSLAAAGLEPLLLDWGCPSAFEAEFSLDDYIAATLIAAITQAVQLNHEKPIILIGYCMGGLLSLAATVLAPHLVSRLVLLATPWDFHSDPILRLKMNYAIPLIMARIEAESSLSVITIQSMIMALDPLLSLRKFSRIARESHWSSGTPLHRFARLEQWLNDGVPLVKSVAQTAIQGWYGENQPARKQWHVANQVIDPQLVRIPTLLIIPNHDRIVPPQSAKSLATALPNATIIEPEIGHVGMMASSRAAQLVWQPIIDWLQ